MGVTLADPLRFYSAALEAAKKIEQRLGTAQQMRAALLRGGAKQKELDYIGAEDLLKSKDAFTRDELVDCIDASQVRPEEAFYKGEGLSDNEHARMNEIAAAMIRANSANEEDAVQARRYFEELTGIDWGQGSGSEGYHPSYELQHITPETVAQGVGTDDAAQDREWDEAYATAVELFGRPESNTRRSHLVTGEPSDVYTEHLVTLPNSAEAKGRMTPGPNPHYVDSDYMSPHWSEPNVGAHMRYDFDPDALRLEEVQSDWLQQGRDHGFRMTPDELADLERQITEQRAFLQDFDARANKAMEERGRQYSWPSATVAARQFEYNKLTDLLNKQSRDRFAIPRAPLSNTNDWTATMLRRAMLEAALADKPGLRWTSGATQDRRYSPQPGRAKYYDEVIPNLLKKIMGKYGDVPYRSEVWDNMDPYAEAPLSENDPGRIDMHYMGIPSKLIEELQKRGKVPFFKRGGRV